MSDLSTFSWEVGHKHLAVPVVNQDVHEAQQHNLEMLKMSMGVVAG